MGLEPNEQRLLGHIERSLRGSGPKLAAKLTAFNRLTGHEAMPLRERLLNRPSRPARIARVAIAAFVMFMILTSATVLSRIGTSRGNATTCELILVQGCQAAGASPHPGHSVVTNPR